MDTARRRRIAITSVISGRGRAVRRRQRQPASIVIILGIITCITPDTSDPLTKAVGELGANTTALASNSITTSRTQIQRPDLSVAEMVSQTAVVCIGKSECADQVYPGRPTGNVINQRPEVAGEHIVQAARQYGVDARILWASVWSNPAAASPARLTWVA